MKCIVRETPSGKETYKSRIGSILFPDVCTFCGAILTPQQDEEARYYSIHIHVCRKCLVKLPLLLPEETVIPVLSNPEASDPIPDTMAVVAFSYEGLIAEAIRKIKFGDVTYPAPALAEFLAGAVSRLQLSFDAVIPIPLSEKRMHKRGYNQAGLIAESLASALGLPCVPQFLLRHRNTSQQSRFSDPISRRANITDAFCVPPDVDVTGLRLLIVDDVVTTGATLHEAALCLSRNGAASIVCAAAATGRILSYGKDVFAGR